MSYEDSSQMRLFTSILYDSLHFLGNLSLDLSRRCLSVD